MFDLSSSIFEASIQIYSQLRMHETLAVGSIYAAWGNSHKQEWMHSQFFESIFNTSPVSFQDRKVYRGWVLLPALAGTLCGQNVWQCPNFFAEHPGIREVREMFMVWEGLNGPILVDLKWHQLATEAHQLTGRYRCSRRTMAETATMQRGVQPSWICNPHITSLGCAAGVA